MSPNDGLFLNSISCSNSMTGCQINPDSSSVRSQSLEKKIKVSVTNTFMNLFCFAYTDEMFDKDIPGSNQEVVSSNCAVIEFLFLSISMSFLNTRSE